MVGDDDIVDDGSGDDVDVQRLDDVDDVDQIIRCPLVGSWQLVGWLVVGGFLDE